MIALRLPFHRPSPHSSPVIKYQLPQHPHSSPLGCRRRSHHPSRSPPHLPSTPRRPSPSTPRWPRSRSPGALSRRKRVRNPRPSQRPEMKGQGWPSVNKCPLLKRTKSGTPHPPAHCRGWPRRLRSRQQSAAPVPAQCPKHPPGPAEEVAASGG